MSHSQQDDSSRRDGGFSRTSAQDDGDAVRLSNNSRLADIIKSGVEEYMTAPTEEGSEDDLLQQTVNSEKAAIETDPNDAAAWFRMSVAQLGLGRCQEAIPALQRVIDLAPQHAKAWRMLGLAFQEIGNFDDASAALIRAIGTAPDWAEVWSDWAGVLAESDRVVEALTAFDEAIKRDRADAITWANRGITLSNTNRNEEALLSFTEAIRLRPDWPDMLFQKGKVLLRIGDVEGALECLMKAIELRASDAEAWQLVGVAHNQLGDTASALEALTKANELAYPYPDALALKAMLLAEERRLDESLVACDEAMARFADAPVRRIRAWILAQQKLYRELDEFVDTSIADGFHEQGLLLVKADVLADNCRFEEALNACYEELKHFPNSAAAMSACAYCLLKLGKVDQAMTQVTTALSTDPTDARSWFVKALFEAHQGNEVDALNALRKALKEEPGLIQTACEEDGFKILRSQTAFRKLVGR